MKISFCFPLLFLLAACQPLPTAEALPEMVKVKIYTEFCLKEKNNYVEISNLAGVENQPLLAKIKTAVDNAYFEGAKPNDINAYLSQVCAGKIANKRVKDANIYHNKNGLLSIITETYAEIRTQEWATYDLYTGELLTLNPQLKAEKLNSLHDFIFQQEPKLQTLKAAYPQLSIQLADRFYLCNENELMLEWIIDQSQLNPSDKICETAQCRGKIMLDKRLLKDFLAENSPLQRFIEFE